MPSVPGTGPGFGSLVAPGKDDLGALADRVAHVSERDVAFDPADVGVLGADGVVLEADGLAGLTQQSLRALFRHELFPLVDNHGLWLHDVRVVDFGDVMLT